MLAGKSRRWCTVTGSRKKVIVRRFSPGLLRGYLPAAGFVEHPHDASSLELLDLSGRVQSISLQEVKSVSFVRDFNLSDDANPERLPRRSFLARPRTEGLWIRMILRDDDQIEGLAPLDLTFADALTDDRGIQFTPPDVRGNTLRMYIPRSAMISLQVVAVVTTPTRRKVLEALQKPASDDDPQFSLELQANADGVAG
jgi:hypothetical protein